jgi:predicted AAA+ superfamily ATPase
MASTLDQLVEESRTRPLPRLTRRDVRIPDVPDTAVAFVGMRRSGKSYLMFQRMSEVLQAGVPRSSLLYLNLEDDRLGAPTLETLDEALEALFRMGAPRHEQTVHLFLDEIQNVAGWERFVLRVINTENAKVFVSGSSAKLLSTEIATGLRGRNVSVEVLPFSFREYLRHQDAEPVDDSTFGSAARSKLGASFLDYLRRGGFPAVQRLEEVDRIRTLQDYIDLVVFRDVVERHAASNLPALRWLVGHLLSAFSREFSVNRLYNDLKSQGMMVGKDTLHAYLDHLVDARLLFPVSIRRASYRARMVNPRKMYVVDCGLAVAATPPSVSDTGHLLENAVHSELRRRLGVVREGAISYWSDGSGGAVDLVVDDGRSDPALIQVCADFRDPGTRVRELRGIEAGMVDLGVRSGTVVTLFESERVDTASGRIDVVPAWRWMLESP